MMILSLLKIKEKELFGNKKVPMFSKPAGPRGKIEALNIRDPKSSSRMLAYQGMKGLHPQKVI